MPMVIGAATALALSTCFCLVVIPARAFLCRPAIFMLPSCCKALHLPEETKDRPTGRSTTMQSLAAVYAESDFWSGFQL